MDDDEEEEGVGVVANGNRGNNDESEGFYSEDEEGEDGAHEDSDEGVPEELRRDFVDEDQVVATERDKGAVAAAERKKPGAARPPSGAARPKARRQVWSFIKLSATVPSYVYSVPQVPPRLPLLPRRHQHVPRPDQHLPDGAAPVRQVPPPDARPPPHRHRRLRLHGPAGGLLRPRRARLLHPEPGK